MSQYVKIFEIDTFIVHDFFFTLYEHQDYIGDSGNKDDILEALNCYALGYEPPSSLNNGNVVPRGIFKRISDALGWDTNGPCTYPGIVSRLFDAAAETALTLTGVGGVVTTVLGGANAADSIYEYFDYALDCVD